MSVKLCPVEHRPKLKYSKSFRRFNVEMEGIP
jgi:hypothetical protein